MPPKKGEWRRSRGNHAKYAADKARALELFAGGKGKGVLSIAVILGVSRHTVERMLFGVAHENREAERGVEDC